MCFAGIDWLLKFRIVSLLLNLPLPQKVSVYCVRLSSRTLPETKLLIGAFFSLFGMFFFLLLLQTSNAKNDIFLFLCKKGNDGARKCSVGKFYVNCKSRTKKALIGSAKVPIPPFLFWLLLGLQRPGTSHTSVFCSEQYCLRDRDGADVAQVW